MLFLDIKLPDIDGLKFASFAKRHYPKIQIIIISGYYRDGEVVQQCHANSLFYGFIGKPFNISEIRSAIETIAPPQ